MMSFGVESRCGNSASSRKRTCRSATKDILISGRSQSFTLSLPLSVLFSYINVIICATMAFMADTVPTFASARAADVILSDVRATSITPDALRAVNILLDELLWLILSNARSLDLSRLKTGVLKTIPTQLGKDAILEAEIEIRAYRDKTHSRPRTTRPSEDILSAFPLQEAFEFLRLKCQVLSSFGEIEEDPILESRLLENYTAVSPLSPSQDFIEPAPLYVTAVIEHVCQHVLGNVAKVVARDSSRTAADLVILYTSLCEDSSMYPIFKTMKVQSHIQSHIKPNTLTRTQSITQPEDVRTAPPITPFAQTRNLGPARRISSLS
ncbi:hypothetical protein BS47DRAFT_399600 [Hydnum rufescens UP504]|uniref:Uncharacterized protein n=1 Tax=Hydnum rufescens UP504 TaxID=1448309 RepID=A0A9P6BAU5_9AGAM|nr:hypothetical protein BS47DRAFT_399600 [Hydnum rufescens UP504]